MNENSDFIKNTSEIDDTSPIAELDSHEIEANEKQVKWRRKKLLYNINSWNNHIKIYRFY